MASTVPAPKTSLPPVVPLLALGTFLMCTTEFLIAGLLPQIADDFGVRASQVGLLITAFAIGMIIGAPLMAVATLRLPKRATLVLALAIFAAGHVIAALSDRSRCCSSHACSPPWSPARSGPWRRSSRPERPVPERARERSA